MRTLLLFLVATLTIASDASGQCAYGDCLGDRADAQRAWEIATLEQRLYRQVGYPARLAAVRSEIDFAEARVEMLRRRLLEYRPRVHDFRYGSALGVSIQQTQLELLREQRNLRNLQQHLIQINRRHRDERTLHALRVEAAAANFARTNASDAEPYIEIVSHDRPAAQVERDRQ